jgi:folate-binding protein YgfZ
LIEVSGEDATTYLEGQLSNRLDAASGRSLVLEPRGVVLADLLRVPDAALAFVVADGVAGDVIARLKRFILRVDVSIVDRGEGHAPFPSLEARIEAGWPGAPEFGAGLLPHAFGASFVAATVDFTKGCFTGQELVGRMDAREVRSPFVSSEFAGRADQSVMSSCVRPVPTGLRA